MNDNIKEDLLNFIRESDNRVTSLGYVAPRDFPEYDQPKNTGCITDEYYELGLVGKHFIVKCTIETTSAFSPKLDTIEINKDCVVNKRQFDNWREKQYAITWL